MKHLPHQLYVIHFDPPYKGTRHYTGIAVNAEKRLERHRRGDGAKLLRAVFQDGERDIKMHILMTGENYSEAKAEEKRLKSWNNAKKYCPECKKDKL